MLKFVLYKTVLEVYNNVIYCYIKKLILKRNDYHYEL